MKFLGKFIFFFLKNLFSGLSIKSHKKNKASLSLSLENTNLEQVTTTVKI